MNTPLLEIKNATKVYGGGFLRGGPTTVALQDFNLTIEARPATITTIAGESGSGKTTLANLVLGFVKNSSGQIVYDGVDVAAIRQHDRDADRRILERHREEGLRVPGHVVRRRPEPGGVHAVVDRLPAGRRRGSQDRV